MLLYARHHSAKLAVGGATYAELIARNQPLEATPSGRGLVYTGPTADRRARIVVGGGSVMDTAKAIVAWLDKQQPPQRHPPAA